MKNRAASSPRVARREGGAYPQVSTDKWADRRAAPPAWPLGRLNQADSARRSVPVPAGVAQRGGIERLLQAPLREGRQAAQGQLRVPQHQIHA